MNSQIASSNNLSQTLASDRNAEQQFVPFFTTVFDIVEMAMASTLSSAEQSGPVTTLPANPNTASVKISPVVPLEIQSVLAIRAMGWTHFRTEEVAARIHNTVASFGTQLAELFFSGGAHFRQKRINRGPADAQDLGGSLFISAHRFQNPLHMLLLKLFKTDKPRL